MYRGEIDALRQIAMFFFGENAEFFFFSLLLCAFSNTGTLCLVFELRVGLLKTEKLLGSETDFTLSLVQIEPCQTNESIFVDIYSLSNRNKQSIYVH
jgi:hypothetical protein